MERSRCPTKLTDLFCLAILFAKFNMLAIFILHFLTNIAPNDFQWSNSMVSRPIKFGGKLFIADGKQIVLSKFIGRVND